MQATEIKLDAEKYSIKILNQYQDPDLMERLNFRSADSDSLLQWKGGPKKKMCFILKPCKFLVIVFASGPFLIRLSSSITKNWRHGTSIVP